MNATINGQEKSLQQGTTLDALLRDLELSPIRVAVEINEDLVSRKKFGETIIQEGDTIEIVTFVGGG